MNKLSLMCVAFLAMTAAACGKNTILLQPLDAEVLTTTIMRVDAEERELPQNTFSDGQTRGFRFVSPLIPGPVAMPGSDESEALTLYRQAPVIWIVPGRPVQLNWELAVSVVSEDLGFDKNAPQDVGLCTWPDVSRGKREYFFYEPDKLERVTTNADIGDFDAGDVLMFDRLEIGQIRGSMQDQVQARLSVCDGTATSAPNAFNLPTVVEGSNCAPQNNPCDGADLWCMRSGCSVFPEQNARFVVQALLSREGDTNATQTDRKVLGPSVNVPKAFPAPAPDAEGVIDMRNVPADAPRTTRIIRPLIWNDAENAWTWSAMQDGQLQENFTLDFSVGAVRIFAVHPSEQDFTGPFMTYPGMVFAGRDGKRRIRSNVTVRFKEFGQLIEEAIPAGCIDSGQGVLVANCPVTRGSTTPTYRAVMTSAIANPIIWLVDVQDAHPDERSSDWPNRACDIPLEPASYTSPPCVWDSDIVVKNSYYIEFYKVGDGDSAAPPGAPVPPTPPDVPFEPPLDPERGTTGMRLTQPAGATFFDGQNAEAGLWTVTNVVIEE